MFDIAIAQLNLLRPELIINVGDLIEVNMVDLGMRRVEKGFKISAATQDVLETLHVVVFREAQLDVDDDDRDSGLGSALDALEFG